MKKSDLVAAVAAHQKTTTSEAQRQVTFILTTLADALAQGEDVALPGIGTLRVKTKAARKGWSMHHGKEIEFPPCKVIRFKVAEPMKNRLAAL